MPNKNPDPENFARAVLWHLAGLRADLLELQLHVFEDISVKTGVPMDEVQKRFSEEAKLMRDKTYAEALRAAGLENPPPLPPEDDSIPGR